MRKLNILIAMTLLIPMTTLAGGGPIPIEPFDGEVLSSDLQSNGKLISGGKFTSNRLKRLNTDTDNSIDTTFESTWTISGFNGDINVVKVLPDDSILVGGAFTAFNSSLAGYIARIQSDGQFDSAFAATTGTGFDGPITTISALSDGSFIVGGDFTDFNGTSVSKLVRLFSNGSLDTSFTPQTLNGSVLTSFVDSSNQCLVGGSFTASGAKDRLGIIQLLVNGLEDTVFFGQVD